MTPEQPDSQDTADGRPTTRAMAHARLARMMCSDAERFSLQDAEALARRAHEAVLRSLNERLHRVCAALPQPPRVIVVSGSGSFLAGRLLERAKLGAEKALFLDQNLSPAVSEAACAYALAVLAEEST